MICIQARSTSKRFPGKILEPFGNTFMLDHIYQTCSLIEKTAVLIPKDDQCIPYLKTANIPYFEGDENDVLSRYYEAAKEFKAPWVMRITGDCPLINPANMVYALYLLRNVKSDFISNCIYPCIDGQEVEIISFRLLRWLNDIVKDEYHREHVTTYIKERLHVLKGFCMHSWQDCINPDLMPKMSVDTREDLERCRKIWKDTQEAEWQSQL